MKVSVFPHIGDKKPVSEKTINEVLSWIRTGKFKEQVNRYRETKADQDKKTIPYFTPCGTFSHRTIDGFKDHSGVIVLDVEDSDIDQKYADIAQDPYTYFIFRSVGGKGLAVGVKIDIDRHQDSFDSLSGYYEEEFGITSFKGQGDITRARFFSYDPDMFINPHSETWDAFDYIQSEPRLHKNIEVNIPGDISELQRRFEVSRHVVAEKWGIEFVAGGRHNYMHRLACVANRVGINDMELRSLCEQFLEGYSQWDTKDQDNSIQNVYTTWRDQHGRPKKREAELLKLVSATPGQHQEKPSFQFMTAKGKKIEEAAGYISTNYDVFYNEVLEEIQVDGQRLSDTLFNNIYIELHRNGINISKDDLKALCHSTSFPTKHPFHNFFEELIPQGKGHIKELAKSIKQDTYLEKDFELFFTKWLVGVVANCYDRNINEIELVFSGPQNVGKTYFFRSLLPLSMEEYYMEMSNLNKDYVEALSTEALILFDDEYDTNKPKDVEKKKALISSIQISYKKKFSNFSTRGRRFASFCASSNRKDLLHDITGNRRIIPVWVYDRDFEAADKVDRNSLWAEAYTLFREGFDFKMRKKDIAILEKNAAVFQSETVERDLIKRYIVPVGKEMDEVNLLIDYERLSTTDIINRIAYEIPSGSVRINPRVFGQELTSLGYMKTKSDGRRVYKLKMRIRPTKFNSL